MVRLLRPDRPRARSYFSRREQWRLFMLVFAAGVVVFMIRELQRAETTSRLAQFFAAAPAAQPHVDVNQAAVATKPQQAELSAESLGTIRDNTYFRTTEKDAWFELMAKLQRTSAAELAARSVGEVGYAQLAQQPGVYRAKVVTVHGTVRQVTEEKPAANELGLESYYRLVVQPNGGEIWPIFVYALELPTGFPRGEKVAVDVSATGFFFKNVSYQWQDGVGIAPVILAKDVARLDAAAETNTPASTANIRPPIAADTWRHADADSSADAELEKRTANLSEVLSLAGWDAARLAQFADGQPLTPDSRQALVQLLWRVKTFDTVSIAAWTKKDISIAAIAANPAEYRGQFVRLSGRVRRLQVHALPTADAERLEMPRYYECELVLDNNAGAATVLTSRVPQSWEGKAGSANLDELATVAGLFIQMLPAAGDRPHVLLIAQQVAADSFGRAALATLGMDTGLLDGIRNHQRILGSERDAFYHLLAAINEVGVQQLIRFAQDNLGPIAEAWESELKSGNAARRALAEEVTRRAADGRFSVAPLFNDADRQIGQLIVVDGIARRIVRVEASGGIEAGGANDVARRLGVDHYYEMQVFTEDSQNRPLVFCVRELPAGMTTGDDLREPVRVAGFSFKSWKYRTRDAGGQNDNLTAADALGKQLIAPLIIGRGPVRIQPEQSASPNGQIVLASLFVLALFGIWGAAWWFARGDRRFRQRTAATSFSLPPGQSLDGLNVTAVGEPMNIVGPLPADPHNLP